MIYDKHNVPLIVGDYVKSGDNFYQIIEIKNSKVTIKSIRYGWIFKLHYPTSEKVDSKEIMFELLKGQGN